MWGTHQLISTPRTPSDLAHPLFREFSSLGHPNCPLNSGDRIKPWISTVHPMSCAPSTWRGMGFTRIYRYNTHQYPAKGATSLEKLRHANIMFLPQKKASQQLSLLDSMAPRLRHLDLAETNAHPSESTLTNAYRISNEFPISVCRSRMACILTMARKLPADD